MSSHGILLFFNFHGIPIDFTTPRINPLCKTNEKVKYTCTFEVLHCVYLSQISPLSIIHRYFFLHIVNI